MARTMDVVERKPGERCCDGEVHPRISGAAAERLAEQMLLLANPIRLQLLDVLLRNEGRVCVCDLEASVPVKQPTVSHHLKLLRDAGLLENERQGQWAYYRVNRDALDQLRGHIVSGLASIG